MRLLLLFIVSTLGCVAQELPKATQHIFDALDKSVDYDWKRVPLNDVLQTLAKRECLAIAIDKSVAERGTQVVTFHGANIRLGELLNRIADRLALDVMISSEGKIELVPVPGAKPAPEWVDDARPVRQYHLGPFQRLPPPNGWDDPIASLGDGDAAALAKPAPAVWSKLLDGHLDRIEAWHIAHSAPPTGLIEFLKAHPNIRKEFWCALDPRFDIGTNACRVLDELRLADEKRFLANFRVAIAMAVVHDSPEAAVSSRYYTLWAVKESQFGTPLSYLELWDYFTDPKHQAQFLFKPKELAWPMLVHLVDLDVSQGEIEWALNQYGTRKVDLTALYSSVPYDYSKLGHIATKLGSQPYTLVNLLSCGGVCVDQAHFASRVAKIYGVPSLKCGGYGRYGGVGHAWSGYLAAKGRAPDLQFTGRYQFDFYYTGTAFDPQTRTEVLDRDVELLYAGVSGAWETWADSAHLARIARNLNNQPELATVIAREAVKRNPLVAESWRALLHAVPPAEVGKTWQTMTKSTAAFPDLVWECLRLSLDRMPPTDKERQKLYDTAYTLAGGAKRPDIQIQIRLAQIGELAEAKQDKDVIRLAFETVRANVKEGTLIMPLVKRVVELANEFHVNDPSFRMNVVRDTFAKLATEFPKARGDDVSPAWEEWQELVKTLK